MRDPSDYQWTDTPWNPTRGCTKISPGCEHCYAEVFSEQHRGTPGHPFEKGFDFRLVPSKLLEPLRWSQSKMVFVNSMSDLFHEDVPEDYIVATAKVMQAANWHVYQVFTKRSERLRDMLQGPLRFVAEEKHIWWGVSIEDRRHSMPRAEHLRAAGAAMAVLAFEPLLEDIGEIDLAGIAWVTVGGETGPKARPMRKSWVRSIRRQCRAARVPFFFKQWGGTGKKLTGRLIDGRAYDAIPEIERRSVVPVDEAALREIVANCGTAS